MCRLKMTSYCTSVELGPSTGLVELGRVGSNPIVWVSGSVWVVTECYAKFSELLVLLMFELYSVLTPEMKISLP